MEAINVIVAVLVVDRFVNWQSPISFRSESISLGNEPVRSGKPPDLSEERGSRIAIRPGDKQIADDLFV
jgi:hypothetical protein